MHISKTSLRGLHAALLVGGLLSTSSVTAASQCKGVQQDACGAKVECVWVDSYTRKDGRAVSSHCKSRGGKKSANQSSSSALNLSAADKP